jgi:hypothetical protein
MSKPQLLRSNKRLPLTASPIFIIQQTRRAGIAREGASGIVHHNRIATG